MLQGEDILISVEYDHVLRMLNGLKTAEIRRRQLRIQPGTRVWIYSKLPRGHVELVATAAEVVAASPRKLWELYQERIAITASEFRTYLQGVDVGCAILFRDIRPVQPTLTLDALRRISRNFHPPQFFKRLSGAPELQSFLSSSAAHRGAGAGPNSN
jgi:predicted transcriptional regulator